MRKYRATREWGRVGVNRTSSKRNLRSNRLFRYVGLLLIICSVFFVGRNFGINKAEEVSVMEEPQLDIGGTPVSGDTVSDILSGSVLSVPLDNAIVLDSSSEAEADIAQDTTDIAVMNDAIELDLLPVGDTHGSGTASVQFVDGVYQHVAVGVLPDPPLGYFYEGWLIRSKPFDFFSTGRFIQHADDLRWYLLYESDDDKMDYRKVIVTLEPDDGDPAPADHVLEGVF